MPNADNCESQKCVICDKPAVDEHFNDYYEILEPLCSDRLCIREFYEETKTFL